MSNKKCYLGLDIGTASVGWAVTDENYEIPKAKGKKLWGTYLFSEAHTAKKRRGYRNARRRLARRRGRINYLQEIFAEEVNKVDPTFFLRLNNSALHREDKGVWEDGKLVKHLDTKYSLFDDLEYTDYDFHKEYKTIYHLIDDLINNKEKKFDIRLVYLACHHLIKYRGHFIMEGVDLSIESDSYEYLEQLLAEIDEFLLENYDNSGPLFTDININRFMSIFLRKDSFHDTTRNLRTLIDVKQNSVGGQIVAGISGGKVTVAKLFENEEYEDIEKKSFKLSDRNFDEEIAPDLSEEIGEDFYLVELLRSIHRFILMKQILGDNKYLSAAMVDKHDKHARDLKRLKKLIKRYYEPEIYNSFFREATPSHKEVSANYSQYIGMTKVKGVKTNVKKKEQKHFYSAITKLLDNDKIIIRPDQRFEDEKEIIKDEIARKVFLPLITIDENSSLPYQLNLLMLEEILKNSIKTHPFLLFKDEEGKTNSDKIMRILSFRIPYYVGPLNDVHQGQPGINNWLVRKEEGDKEKITPFNFEEKVDLARTQQAFIRRMTNKCTYLLTEDVLPKNSLLYEEFMLLNKVNTIKVNGEKLPLPIKEGLIKHIREVKSLTLTQFEEWLRQNGLISKDDKNTISGTDTKAFKLELPIYHFFLNVLNSEERFNQLYDEIEQIIFWATVFTDRKTREAQIRKNYPDLFDEEELKKIANFKGKGWGNFSATFLGGGSGFNIYDFETGEVTSLIQLLRSGDKEINGIIHDSRYQIREAIREFNDEHRVAYGSLKDRLEDMYLSPQVKRAIIKTKNIIDELDEFKGAPSKIFVEVARGGGKKGKRTKTRKDYLIELYKTAKLDNKLLAEIEGTDANKFNSKRVYLYYLQQGKCAYSGESITLADINATYYEIDHIYPQSKIKDDSFTNLVLVTKAAHSKKGDDIVPAEVRMKFEPTWKSWLNKNLISREKYNRLTRSYPLTDEELLGFVNRQLVTTRQATKVVIELLKERYPEAQVVYTKAGNVSDFRNEFGMLKNREINNLHHAKDAYLSIVVGNVWHTKFTSNPRNFMEQGGFRENYNIKKLYEYDINGAWIAQNDKTLKHVKKTEARNDVSVVRATETESGRLYNEALSSAAEGLLPFKEQAPFDDTSKYGGYDRRKPAYFVLIESLDKKGEKIRTIQEMPLLYVERFETDEEFAKEFLSEYYGLREPKLIKKIRKYSEIWIDDTPLLIAGTGGSQLRLHNSAELLLTKKWENYHRSLLKISNQKARYLTATDVITLNEVKDESGEVKTNSITIDKVKNEEFFDELLRKAKLKTFENSAGKYADGFENGKETFQNLTVIDQVEFLIQMVKVFSAKTPPEAKLELLGLTNFISFKTSKTLHKKIVLRTYSPTGLYQKDEVLFEGENK